MMDNLADIELKLTCVNSIAAMNIIYLEQMKCHRATEGQRVMDGLLGEDEDDEKEFLQPYIVSNSHIFANGLRRTKSRTF